MIKLLEAKDIEWLFTKVDELNERTKKHTKEIHELRRMIKTISI